ncbi:MAG: hypothetical protein KatS3mg009_1814 [Acidimicrobiia bacterium]|nr:MAG: hypothetical protein KatS3mg009_1814 [Acidimicrobiia bacterium]
MNGRPPARVPVGLRCGAASDAPHVARLHADRIGEGFLATLGVRFLTRLYRRIASSRHAFVVVADREGQVVGFVAVATTTGGLYREFLVRDGVAAAVAALPALARAPRRVWETLRYGTGPRAGDLPDAEILALAVDPRAAGAGIGRRLAEAALRELGRRGVRSARVVTAVGNTAALATYRAAGFRPHGRTEVHRGTPQEVLVWP